jgi:DNA-binding transcriptional MocR family regulator
MGPPSADNRKQIAKQKLQSYIMKNLAKGVGELRVDEAQRDLQLAPQEILDAYNELVKEGWIKGKPDANKPGPTPNQPPPQQPPQAGQQQPPQPPQQPNAYEEAVSKLPPGEVPRDRFDANSPFLER